MSMRPASISVIVVSYYTGPALWVCLRRLLQQESVSEIIVVNNGNAPEVNEKLAETQQNHAKIHVLSGHGNVGFAKACNMGVAQATGDFVLLLNPDAVLMQPDAAQKMAELLMDDTRSTQLWMVGAILRDEKGREQRASRRMIMTPMNALYEGLGLSGKGLGVNLHDTPLPNQPFPVMAISGACMMLTRERYHALNGLDEGYFLHVEDMDLCKRIYDEGGTIWIDPKIEVLHFTSTSASPKTVVEAHKLKGFKRYFRIHFKHRYISRALFMLAARLRLCLFWLRAWARSRYLKPRRLTTPIGVRQVAAILRGQRAAKLEKLTGQGVGTSVLVTGASTSVALFAIGRLLEMGSHVIAVTHQSQICYFHPNLKWIRANLSHPQEVQEMLEGTNAQFIMHAAPIWLLENILPILKQLGMERIVAISSTSIEGKQASNDPQEQATIRKLLDAEATMAAKAKSLVFDWTIIRPTMIYGAGLDNNVSRMAHMADQWGRFPVELPALGKRAPVHADDVAAACLRALAVRGASGKTYVIQGGSILPFRALVERAAKLMDAELEIIGVPQFANLLSLLHRRNPDRFPHPAVLERMRHDLLFPDDMLVQDLRLKPREYLAGGIMDLGQISDTQCYSLMDSQPKMENAA